MAQDWSEHIQVSNLSDDPQLAEELSLLTERVSSAPIRTARHVVLNFASVNYISSSHLAQMLRLRKRLADHGRSLMLCGLSDQLWSVLMLTGLDRVFRHTSDTAAALTALQMELPA
jgi:anti-anti-sigma factor